jgi:hypothetical protein
MKLTVEVIDNKLIIAVDINTLIHSLETYENFELSTYDNETGELLSYKVTDKNEFIKDFLRVLKDEEEDGTTLLHMLFDIAMTKMIEEGSFALSEKPTKGN